MQLEIYSRDTLNAGYASRHSSSLTSHGRDTSPRVPHQRADRSLKDLELPPLGQAVRAAPLVTKTLLFVTEGDQINVRTPPGGGGNKIRAYDKATGAIVCEYQMDAGSTGTLMTYLFKGKTVHRRRHRWTAASGGAGRVFA